MKAARMAPQRSIHISLSRYKMSKTTHKTVEQDNNQFMQGLSKYPIRKEAWEGMEYM